MFQREDNSTSLIWEDGSPVSFQAWQKAGTIDLNLKKGHEEIESIVKDTASVLQPTRQEKRLRTVALIVSSVHLDWATIPCDQLVSDVLVICQRPH